MLVFCQDTYKETDIYIRGYVHERNAECVERTSIFGSVFTYPRKKIEDKLGGCSRY